MDVLVVFTGGVLLGLLVGRWWALLGPAALGAWITFASDVEVSPLFLGVSYAAVCGVGVALGLVVRRLVVWQLR